ncbi:MAG: cytochrome ubiquinol oxidase subunit I [Bacillota bacterium]
MDQVLLARWQFGLTTGYHFLFVPLTIGLSLLVAIMETLYVKKGKESYKKMAQFWGRLFVINFAMGVVTGIVIVFQFGMNWSEYSRFVGNIFGIPLAIEALLAFFLESTFLGIWLFGWDKVSKKVHLLSAWLVAIASSLSSLWILVANSFMQNPVGYELVGNRAELVGFGKLLANPYFHNQFTHVIAGAFVTGAVFVISISAYHLLKKNRVDFFKESLRIGLIFGLISVIIVGGIGHLQGQFLVKTKPMKMSAAEALWETSDPAPFALLAIIDQEKGQNKFEITIPAMTSFMSYNKFSGEVKGLNDLQKEMEALHGSGNYIPPVTPIFWSFRFMVGIGSLIGLLVLLAVYATRKQILEEYPLLLKLLFFILPLPFLANLFGWIMAEMGRQPWIVSGLLKVDNAVSPNVSPAAIWTTMIGFSVVYILLAIADIYLLAKFAKQGPEDMDLIKEPNLAEGEVSLWA